MAEVSKQKHEQVEIVDSFRLREYVSIQKLLLINYPEKKAQKKENCMRTCRKVIIIVLTVII